MKQEKGITMISLMIVVIILAIIIGIGIRTASPLVKESNIKDVTTELMLIQAKWKTEREKVNFNGNSLFDEEIINTEEGEKKGKLKDEYQYETKEEVWVEEGIQYYRLPDKALENMGLTLEKNLGYLVNYENDEIIYIPGIEDEKENMHYKLSDIKGL